MNEVTLRQFVEWLKQASEVDRISFNRCYFKQLETKRISLIGFSDASKLGYAACIYVRVEYVDGSVDVNLVIAKTRISPLVQQTIPRLELLAALILTRLMQQIVQVLVTVVSIDEIVYFTDSEVVIHWIKNVEKTYTKFVENRVKEIRSKSEIAQWSHIPGKENIADVASRGCDLKKLANMEEWFKGPQWLRRDMDTWFKNENEDKIEESTEEDVNIDVENVLATQDVGCDIPDIQEENSIVEIIDPQRYSSLQRLINVTILVLRFINRCRKRNNDKASNSEIEEEEGREAKCIWIKYLQKELEKQTKFKKTKVSLGIVKDQHGIYRCTGRIQRANVNFEAKHPVILPNNHYLTKLFVEDAHERVYHNGVKETLSQLRSQFWIVRGRQVVKRILKDCYLCKNLEGLPYSYPDMSPLPEFRLTGERSFKYTGIDFCGPVFIKYGNKMVKSYIALITCAVSRMVYLELFPDLSSPSLIRCLKRFAARRGIPSLINIRQCKNF